MDQNENDLNQEDKAQIQGYGNHRRPRSYFGRGLGLGIFAGFLAAIIVLTIILGTFYSAGFIHVGDKGDIYVQDTATNDSEGIGSRVENKLNTLDSALDGFYFDNVDDEAAADNIYKAYLESYGDKYTVYYTPEEYKQLVESTTGTFYGIGAVCQKNEDGSILVSDAYEDAPAYKAGIRTGDCIVTVDGNDITDKDLTTAVSMIKGDKGTSVELEVRRDGSTFTVTVTRDEVNAQTVSSKMLDNQIGYLYISQFDTITASQFTENYNSLKDQGMKSLIVDIRYNPGGVLGTVAKILDQILPDGLIVYTEDKNGKRSELKGTNSEQIDVPMAVLVNGNSASASEIFAGAVQDYGVGKIIGTQTYGKGIVQTIKSLTDGSAIKFTIAKYYTPKGQDIHGHGVTPDMVVDLPSDAKEDVQLNAAIDYLMGEMAK
jgi:carboxyl-terminal processing protease